MMDTALLSSTPDLLRRTPAHRPGRRQAVGWLVGSGLAGLISPASQAQTPPTTGKPVLCVDEWPAWSLFRTNFVAADGRVVDPDTPRAQTVSEAQAYGLFFALVANDRPSFESILKWTENNLAGGDLTARLPAWIWGRRDDGNWGVVDANPASDADLWIVYALAEAGRLWGDKRLSALSRVIAERMLRESIVNLPGLGPTLLPGPKGFQLADDRWRLNPSYFPMHLLRWLSTYQPHPSWGKVAASARKIILSAVPKGFAPDWVAYQAGVGFQVDEGKGDIGGYDAIRVYLWAGMMHPGDPLSRTLLDALAPMAKRVAKDGFPPETIHILTGEGMQAAPSGFSAAMLPFLQARGDKAALQAQLSRLQAKPIRPKVYYEQALNLFGMGWHEGYFKLAADGRLQPKWRTPCPRMS